MTDPVLEVDEPTGSPTAIALVLHGGRANGTGGTNARQLAVVRMRPFVRSLRRAGADRGLVVARLRYQVRGWNGASASPVPDVRWALDRLAERFPGLPTALVGHSMGGRAAVYAGGHPTVTAVVGLAPWIEPGDPFTQLARRRLLFVHGDLDRMTSPRQSATFLRESARIAASSTYVSVRRERHAMLRRATLWHELATGFVLAVMCNRPPEETVGRESANVLGKALGGETSLVV
ncbi:MAG TPA: alpha/beta fold hydrolase [Jatrophihabitans sp.]|jgi:pimeloyl-ACP methyl ester carboxylesterase|uniref:alpha/beta hydrolase n=1 Tax=Jatrophihabitans sp. TaxID=1932789 RepID=UPI002E0BE508|nr:alpha/beta fold hydrolase [Jatrophihabitans sp.]